MLSVAKITSESGLQYYGTGDGGEEVGTCRWFGGLAAREQLHETATLVEGWSQIRGLRAVHGVAGWDLTFSAPKSVSILWAAGDAVTKQAIEQSLWRAVEAALGVFERSTHLARAGHRGVHQEPALMAAGCSMHIASREGDPQLHVHAVVPNIALRRDGKLVALWSRALFQGKMAVGALFRCELAHQLRRQLGVELVVGAKGVFELRGMPAELLEAFSKRSKAIQELLAGTPWAESAKAKELAALSSRESKHRWSREELLRSWKEQLGHHLESVRGLVREPLAQEPKPAADAWKEAVRSLEDGQSTFSRFDLIRRVASLHEALGVAAGHVMRLVESGLTRGRLVHVGPVHGQEHWTTRRILREEERVLRAAERSAESTGRHVPKWVVSVLTMFARVARGLFDEQKSALFQLAQGSNLHLIRGVAGAGKTRLLAAAGFMWRAMGRKVLLFAPTHRAARELEAATGVTAGTVAALLVSRKVPTGSVMVVDEAGMLSTADAGSVFAIAEANSCKVVLVGDERQLQPVARGGIFKALWDRLGGSELSEGKRQHTPWLQDAVRHLADGETRLALWLVHRAGRFFSSESEDACVRELVRTWERERTEDLRDTMVIANRRSQVRSLNEALQAVRIASGAVDPWKSVVEGGVRFCVGDRVTFTATQKESGIANGDFGTVLAVKSGMLRVRLDHSDWTTWVLPSMATQPVVQLGYAVTTYKSQGVTVEKVFVLASEEQDRSATYVQFSRARSDAWCFVARQTCENLSGFADAVGRVGEKRLAVDLSAARRDHTLEPHRTCHHEQALD